MLIDKSKEMREKCRRLLWIVPNVERLSDTEDTDRSLLAGIEFKKNLRVRFGNYGGLKLDNF